MNRSGPTHPSVAAGIAAAFATVLIGAGWQVATRPTMRFVELESEEQLDIQSFH